MSSLLHSGARGWSIAFAVASAAVSAFAGWTGLVNGDFESQRAAYDASAGYLTSVDAWFDSGSTGGGYNPFIMSRNTPREGDPANGWDPSYNDPPQPVNNTIMCGFADLGNGAGYIYQQIGTCDAETYGITVSFDGVRRGWNQSAEWNPVTVEVWTTSSSAAGADGTDLATLPGATLRSSQAFNQAAMGMVGPDNFFAESKHVLTKDLVLGAGAVAGDKIWLRIKSNNYGAFAESYLDNIVVTPVSAPPPSIELDYPSTVLSLSPLGYWRLNELSSTVDAATNRGTLGAGFNGVYLNGATHQSDGALAGDAGRSANFSGLGSIAKIPWSAEMNPGSNGLSAAFSVECWARTAGAAGNRVLVQSMRQPTTGNTGDRSGWCLRHAGANVEFLVGDVNTVPSYWIHRVSGAVSAGVWQHWVVTYDGTQGGVKIYLDGVLQAHTVYRNDTGNPATAEELASYQVRLNTDYPECIGERGFGGWGFSGEIDEVAIYGEALAAGVVLTHYQNGTDSGRAKPYETLVGESAPLGYYRLDEPVFTPVTALNLGSLGAAADGTYNGGATPGAAGLPNPPYIGMVSNNTAAHFDGSGSVNCGSDAGFNVSAMSIAAWVKSDGILDYMNILAKGGTLWRLNCNGAANTLEWVVPGGGCNGTVPVADGNWHHVVAVADSTESKIYVDGALDVIGPGYNGTFNFDAVRIASQGNASLYMWKGTIDEVAFFGAKLTGQNVADLYASRFNGPQPAGRGLYWAPGAGGGGSGTWSSNAMVWATNAAVQGMLEQGFDGALVFGDTAGTVTVEGGVGAALGLSFKTDGYRIEAAGPDAALNLLGGGPSDNVFTVDPGVGMSLGVPVAGSGMTKLGEGALNLAFSNALHAVTLTINEGSLLFAGTAGGAFTIGGLAGAVGIDLTNSTGAPVALGVGGDGADTEYNGSFSGSGSVEKKGSGRFRLYSASTHSGGTTLSTGTLEYANKNAFGTGTITLAGGATWRKVIEEGNTPAVATANPIYLSGGFVNTDISFGGAKNMYLTGPISGPGGFALISDRSGRNIVLSGAKTFQGGVRLAQRGNDEYPFVTINNVGSLGTGPLRCELTGVDPATQGLDVGADLSAGGGVTNGIDIAPGCRLAVNARNNIQLSGVISNAGNFVMHGTQTLILSGTNTFSGSSAIGPGTLVLSNSLALQNSTFSYTSGTLTFAGGITNFVFGGLSGNKDIALTNAVGAPVALIVGNNNGSTTNSGALSGEGTLTKVGSGTLTLAGFNTYSGPTTVAGGGLVLEQPCLNNTADMFLDGNVTLTLAFTGEDTIGGLICDGVAQEPRVYGAGDLGGRIAGAGFLRVTKGPMSGGCLVVR